MCWPFRMSEAIPFIPTFSSALAKLSQLGSPVTWSTLSSFLSQTCTMLLHKFPVDILLRWAWFNPNSVPTFLSSWFPRDLRYLMTWPWWRDVEAVKLATLSGLEASFWLVFFLHVIITMATTIATGITRMTAVTATVIPAIAPAESASWSLGATVWEIPHCHVYLCLWISL